MLMDVQMSWRENRDEKRNRDYWYNTKTKERTWINPHDPDLCRQNEVVQNWLSQLKEQGLEHDDVAEVLQLFDEDESGTVSVAELQAGMKSMGITMSEADMEILIAAFDESGDGQIDHEEITRRLECAGPCQLMT